MSLRVRCALFGLLAILSGGCSAGPGCDFESYSDDEACTELDSLLIEPSGFTQAVANMAGTGAEFRPLQGVCELKCINATTVSLNGAWSSLRDVPAFGKLRRMRTLGFSATNMKNLDGLQRTTVTARLTITSVPERRTDPTLKFTLAGAGDALKELKELEISTDNLESLEAVGPLPALEWVGLVRQPFNGIVHLRGLESATQLRGITIENSGRLTSLEGFPLVQEFSSVSISGTGLTSLRGLPQDMKVRYYLFINGNPKLSACEVAEFIERAALPGANVDGRRNGPCR